MEKWKSIENLIESSVNGGLVLEIWAVELSGSGKAQKGGSIGTVVPTLCTRCVKQLVDSRVSSAESPVSRCSDAVSAST